MRSIALLIALLASLVIASATERRERSMTKDDPPDGEATCPTMPYCPRPKPPI